MIELPAQIFSCLFKEMKSFLTSSKISCTGATMVGTISTDVLRHVPNLVNWFGREVAILENWSAQSSAFCWKEYEIP